MLPLSNRFTKALFLELKLAQQRPLMWGKQTVSLLQLGGSAVPEEQLFSNAESDLFFTEESCHRARARAETHTKRRATCQ